MRSVPEWIGRDDDHWPPPDRIIDRVFDRHGQRCHKCTRLLSAADKWSLDHVIALCNGGKNRESNLAPICSWCKPTKDGEDVKLKAKGYSIRKRARGIHKPKRPIRGWRRMNGDPVWNPNYPRR